MAASQGAEAPFEHAAAPASQCAEAPFDDAASQGAVDHDAYMVDDLHHLELPTDDEMAPQDEEEMVPQDEEEMAPQDKRLAELTDTAEEGTEGRLEDLEFSEDEDIDAERSSSWRRESPTRR